MQTLPANGQAQPLPGKWVIKVTEANHELVREHLDNLGVGLICNEGDYITYDGLIYSEFPAHSGYELIYNSQFKAMVEGEREPQPEPTKPHWITTEEWVKMRGPARNAEQILCTAYCNLVWAGHADLADQLKAKHPEIWPVDYAARLLQSSIAVFNKCYESERPENYIPEMKTWMEDCRNYLTNQKS